MIRVDICIRMKERDGGFLDGGFSDLGIIWRAQGVVSEMAIVESGDKVKLRYQRVGVVSTQMIQTGARCMYFFRNGRKSTKGR